MRGAPRLRPSLKRQQIAFVAFPLLGRPRHQKTHSRNNNTRWRTYIYAHLLLSIVGLAAVNGSTRKALSAQVEMNKCSFACWHSFRLLEALPADLSDNSSLRISSVWPRPTSCRSVLCVQHECSYYTLASAKPRTGHLSSTLSACVSDHLAHQLCLYMLHPATTSTRLLVGPVQRQPG